MQYAAVQAATHELDGPPWLRVESTIMATARLLRDVYDQRFATLDLNLTQASIVVYVSDFGPVSQTKIADHLGQGRAATGATIDRLNERALVERRPDVDDRRVWRIHLTDAGRELVQPIIAIDQTLRLELRAGVTREERHALASILQQLQGNLREATGGAKDLNPKHSTQKH